MEKVQRNRQQTIEITNCPACGGKHSFNLTVVIDEQVGGLFLMTMRTETRTCGLICPVKGTTIVVEVPVTLVSGQSLIQVR